jgi:hypothetical protein
MLLPPPVFFFSLGESFFYTLLLLFVRAINEARSFSMVAVAAGEVA